MLKTLCQNNSAGAPRRDHWFVLAFILLLAVFYPELVIAKQGSLMGDHWEQHYPWAVLMAQSLKQGIWPFWTPLIQCGFPIVAESQMGLFYLPNLILYTLLPIQWAYAYQNIVHFFISGLGTYLYCRAIGLKPVAAFVAGIIFLFGAAYGGAYYNITSLKTIAWFPWVLLAFERLLAVKRWRFAALSAVCMSLAILAGYMQIAFLMIFVVSLYVLFRLVFFSPEPADLRRQWKTAGQMLAACAGAFLLAAPQLFLTFELAQLSNRINLTESYAYAGSLSPFALVTLILPKMQGLFRGNCFYSGIFTLYFVFAAFACRDKKNKRLLQLWISMGIVSLLLALGGWSPLYIGLIKISHFYSFRIPAKFLVFFCFSVAVVAGIGVHVWLEELTHQKERLAAISKRYSLFAAGLFAFWATGYGLVTAGRTMVESFGRWVVQKFIYGKAGHPRDLGDYFESVREMVSSAAQMLSPMGMWQLGTILLILATCGWAWLVLRAVRNRTSLHRFLAIAVAVLILDLYAVAGFDIKRDFDTYQNVLNPNAIVQTLVAEKSEGKLGRIYGFHKGNEPLPLVPSANILYGIEDIGGYSPLILKRYYETIGRFGNVSDANEMAAPDTSYVLPRLALLNALDVSHIISSQELRHPELGLIRQTSQPRAYLYRNNGKRVRGYFLATAVAFSDWPKVREQLMSPGFDPQKVLLFENVEKAKLKGLKLDSSSKATQLIRERHTDLTETWKIETTGPGFFVLTNCWYPGWKARLDGKIVPLLKAYGLFQAVWIPKAGPHSVEFCYNPYRRPWQSPRER